MNASRPWLAGPLLTLAAVTNAAGVDTLEDLLHDSWHTIEIIIFEHATPLDQPSPEDLLHTAERAFPANLRSLAGGAPWPLDTLRPDTRACLERPLPRPAIPTAIPHWAADPTLGLPLLPQAVQPEDRTLEAQAGEELAPPAGTSSAPAATAALAAQAGEELTQPPIGPLEAQATEIPAPSGGRDPTGPLPPSEARAVEDMAPDGGRGLAGPHQPPRPQVVEDLAPSGTQATAQLPFTSPVQEPPPTIEPQLAPHPLLRLLSAAAAFEASLRQHSYRWLAPDDLQLRSEANRIRNAPDLALLWHGSWTQPVPEPSDGQPVLLQLGRQAGAMHQLEGFLEVTQSAILHFRALLWRQAPPKSPTAAMESSAAARPRESAFPPTPGRPAAATGGYMTLDQSRALRRGELHYLDHPKLGILVQISPAAPPAQWREALRTWRTTARFDG